MSSNYKLLYSNCSLAPDTGFEITDPKTLASNMAEVDCEQEGFDIIIECSGFPPALEQALAWTKRGATVMIFGCAPPGKAVRICPEDIFRKVNTSHCRDIELDTHQHRELTILGSLINPTTYSRAVMLAANLGPRYLEYDKLGVAVFNINNYQQAIDQLKRGEIAKAVFKMS